jgi:hypothetical protein
MSRREKVWKICAAASWLPWRRRVINSTKEGSSDTGNPRAGLQHLEWLHYEPAPDPTQEAGEEKTPGDRELTFPRIVGGSWQSEQGTVINPVEPS